MSDGKPALLRHYAVRRVNPFDGVLQVVETHDARAYSTDGHTWRLQVLTQRPDHTWRSFGDVERIEQFFNFGTWSEDKGLQKVPANPVLDFGTMRTAADGLIGGLHPMLDRLPFELIDDYEYWATDSDGKPVALLATTEEPALIGKLRSGRWQATGLSDHGFVSPSLSARGVAATGALGPRQHAEQIERQVRRRAPHRARYHRCDDGSGLRIEHPGDPQHLPAAAFPPLGLTTDWADEAERKLVEDYLAWQAPRLLMLQSVDDTQRRWLEHRACARAEELAAGYRLLPRILDRERIEAARVEARLRHARH